MYTSVVVKQGVVQATKSTYVGERGIISMKYACTVHSSFLTKVYPDEI
jgi:hypothetical protein